MMGPENGSMNRKINLILALAAGLLGGLISRYINPIPAYAQTQSAPKAIRAQSFVLVDEQGTAFGLLGFTPKGVPVIKLLDERGRTIWSTAPQPPLLP
jgi:hypothetical protein